MLLKPRYQLMLAGLCLIVVTILSLIIGTTLVPLSELVQALFPVSYTHLTLPTTIPSCRSRWSPYH